MIITFILEIGCIPFFVGLITGLWHFNTIVSGMLGIGSAAAIIQGYNSIKCIKNIRDVKKNQYFLKHKLELNDKVKDNKNMLYKTHSVTRKKVKNTKDNRVVFTINSIENIPFSDLEQITENINRENTFNFEYPTQEKSKTKRKNC